MFYGAPTNELRPAETWAAAPADPSSLGDVFSASLESIRLNNDRRSFFTAREVAYDRKLDEIFAATGQRFDNPMRTYLGHDEQPIGEPVYEPQRDLDAPRRFDEWRRNLALQFPNKARIIAADRPIEEDAGELAGQAQVREDEVWRRAPSGVGRWGAYLAGVATYAATDPVNWLVNLMTPGVGVGARAVVMGGARAAVANMAAEAVAQPFVQDWRRQAGLDYGVSQAALNIGFAGVAGFGLDAGLRGVSRGAQAALGRVPRLDADGVVIGYEPKAKQAALADAVAGLPADNPVRQALDGDLGALEKVATATGAIEDPAVRGALEAARLGEGPVTKVPGIDAGENEARILQALRHVTDLEEPPPGPVAAPQAEPVLRQGQDAEGLQAARQALAEGQGTAIEIARMVRQWPEAIDASIAGRGEALQQARALARLSEEDFEAVSSGALPAPIAAVVADAVPDQKLHAPLIAQLAEARPASAREARAMLGDLLRAPHRQLEQRTLLGAGDVAADPPRAAIDDVTGPEAKATLEALELEHGAKLKGARESDKIVSAAPAPLREDLDGAARAGELVDLVGACKL